LDVKGYGYVFVEANGHYAIANCIVLCSFTLSIIDSEISLSSSDSLTQTPFHWASCGGHLEVVKLLLAAGAYLDAINKVSRWDGFRWDEVIRNSKGQKN